MSWIMFLSCGDWGGSARGGIFKGLQGDLLVRDFIDHSQCPEVPMFHSHLGPSREQSWRLQCLERKSKLCIANALVIPLRPYKPTVDVTMPPPPFWDITDLVLSLGVPPMKGVGDTSV